MAIRSSARSSALEQFEQVETEIGENFVGAGEHPGEVFDAYAAEHGQTPRN